MINSIVAGTEKINTQDLEQLKKLYNDLVFDVLGLLPLADNGGAEHGALDKVIAMVADIRANAKKNKDWATADKIRDELKAAGVLLKDTKDGYEWSLEQ